MSDPHDLQRFVEAQSRVYDTVVQELGRGHKRTHWMWFVFPQIDGLGFSSTARRYAIKSEQEAKAFDQHPILGPRLRECTGLVLNTSGRTTEQIFGYPDYLKFHSCITLFEQFSDDQELFRRAIDKFYGGQPDQRTLQILRSLESFHRRE